MSLDFIRPMAAAPGQALAAAMEISPYLARLGRRRPDILEALAGPDGPARVVDAAIAQASAAGADTEASEEAVMAALRRAKQAGHMAIAAADLSGLWSLDAVTRALSDLADAALGAALATACRLEGSGEAGIFLVALGKHGARELNYSSDVDVSVFYDVETFDGGRRSPAEAASRVARRMVGLMEAQTEDGYVFRTDLRLRPDPRSTPPAVSTRMAELYYESVGQNWERMVYIKARIAAGDQAAGEAFLAMLEPYVWRRHLDYWAIGDIHAIKRQIQIHGDHAALDEVNADLKLGPGGIREIEFFAQTQQLILGGREPTLRQRRTFDALDALVAAGVVAPGTADVLKDCYTLLRGVEHRIQMVNDEQSHTLPADADARAVVAALCGEAEVSRFDASIRTVRARVNALYAALFEDEARRLQAAQTGNLVFTGVDHDPGTIATLKGMGYSDPGRLIDTISDWHRGKVPATRTVRGREILTALVPDLLAALAQTGEPDLAFTRFATFFAGLSSGVQTLSMMLAEPALLRDVARTLALAPRLSATLSRRPNLMESLLYPPGAAEEVFAALVTLDYAEALDAARRYYREVDFRLGFAVLHGAVSAGEAGTSYADLADTCIRAMAEVSRREAERRFGPQPGRMCVCGLGKLGGRELSAGSDLDIILLYDPAGDEVGGRTWFTRYTQILVTALSAPTAEGLLYEVDMQLRPSGKAGPVAVRLSAFESYHFNEAWTWEHLALTRLRPIHGDAALMAEVCDLVGRVLSAPRDMEKMTADVLDMRRRLARERPAQGLWDIKLAEGGLVDIEFTVQHAILAAGAEAGSVRQPGTRAAIDALEKAGQFTADEAQALREALEVLLQLQQVLRIAVDGAFDPSKAGAGLLELVARAAGAPDIAAAAARLEALKARVAELRCKKIGPLATEITSQGV